MINEGRIPERLSLKQFSLFGCDELVKVKVTAMEPGCLAAVPEWFELKVVWFELNRMLKLVQGSFCFRHAARPFY